MFINHTTGPENESVITAVKDGQVLIFDSSHPNYVKIFESLSADDFDSAFHLYNIENVIQEQFEKLDDDIYLENGQLIYNGEPVNDTLGNFIVDMHRSGSDFRYLVNFLKRLYNNPNQDSREMLFDWMKACGGFTINTDGKFIGYRGLRFDMRSRNSGPGIVNGKKENGHLDNSVGNVIEMYRNQVTFDPLNSCAFGLHVGTYDYASGWGEVVVSVLVDPADVVSVPRNEFAKMRVCRYEVLDIVESKINDSVAESDDSYEEEDVADYDDYGVGYYM